MISNFMPNFSSIQAAVLEINCDGRKDGRKDGRNNGRKEGPEWIDSASQTPFRDTIITIVNKCYFLPILQLGG